MVACLEQWRGSIVGCDDAGLPDQVRDLEAVSRMLHAVVLEAVAELDSRNFAATTGFSTTKRLLEGMLQLSATEAGMRVTHATQLAPRRALSGEVLPQVLPNTAAALAVGEIGVGQIRVIAETMNAIPASASVEQREAAEANLARYARSFTPASLYKIGRHILAHLDQDGPQPRDEPEPAALRGSCGCGSAVMGGWGWRGFWNPSRLPRSVL
jgi:hypothetical protein